MTLWPFSRRRTTVIEKIGQHEKLGKLERLDPQAAYALWARTYPPQPHNALMRIEQSTVLELLPDVRGRTVLDAGCGSGRYLLELTERGALAIGVDLSAAMLARARDLTSKIARADLRALPLRRTSIDLAVCGLVLGDVVELEPVLTEMSRVLRPGGCVVYSVVHPAGAAEGWERTFDADGHRWAVDGHWHSVERHRRACVQAGFTIEEWREPIVDGRAAVLVVRATLPSERSPARPPEPSPERSPERPEGTIV